MQGVGEKKFHRISFCSKLIFNELNFQVEDTKALGIYEPLSVKLQVYKTAIETAILLLRIDDIVSGSKKRDESSGGGGAGPTQEHMME